MLWITAADEEMARAQSKSTIEDKGWLLPQIKQGKQVGDPDLIDDDVLRSAAERALADGNALIVYKDEIISDG